MAFGGLAAIGGAFTPEYAPIYRAAKVKRPE